MRITPHDIRKQQFTSKMLKGYDPQEVDAFLDDVAEDYEAVLKETALLKEQMAAIEEYKKAHPGSTTADAYVALAQERPSLFAEGSR